MRGRAQGGAGGSRRSRQTGSSAEFSDYREYIPGDDIRRLDWNALARFDRLYMKLFMEEQESQVTILLDASASMGAKWDAARCAAEAVGYLALTGGDRLQLHVLKNGKAAGFPQLSGRAAFARLNMFLDSCAPDGKEGSEYFLRVYVDKPGGVTIDDCVSVSRVFNEILDREDYIGDPYTFEVSSPGLGRKLTRDRHFEKSIGEEIQIKFYKEQDGMKECTGILEDFDKDTITIRTDQDMRKYNRKDIASVRCTFDFDE